MACFHHAKLRSERSDHEYGALYLDGIMVRDPRANATGGSVFGTFVSNGALGKPNLWHNVVPVGFMWGNDPTVNSHSESNPKPTKTLISEDLKHTIINTSKDMPTHAFGLGPSA